MATQVIQPQKDGDSEKMMGLATQFGGQMLSQYLGKAKEKAPEKEHKNISAAKRQLAKTEEANKKSETFGATYNGV